MTDSPAPTPAPGTDALPIAPGMLALVPRGSLAERMGIEIIEASPTRVVASMPVEGNTQPYGLLHGGASVVLAETLGSIGSALHAGAGRVAVGVEVNATHHRAARGGRVHGVATPLSLGSTMAAWQIDDHRRRGPADLHLAAAVPAEGRRAGRLTGLALRPGRSGRRHGPAARAVAPACPRGARTQAGR